jgi:hypothetical protein
MSTETQAVAQSFYTVYNEKQPDLLDEILADMSMVTTLQAQPPPKDSSMRFSLHFLTPTTLLKTSLIVKIKL